VRGMVPHVSPHSCLGHFVLASELV